MFVSEGGRGSVLQVPCFWRFVRLRGVGSCVVEGEMDGVCMGHSGRGFVFRCT